jgi:hypothetical protein
MTRYQLAKAEVAFRLEGDEAVIVQLRRKMIHLANPAASVLFQLLQTGATSDALVEALLDRFDVDAEQAQRDVRQLLDAAIEQGLILATEPGEPHL